MNQGLGIWRCAGCGTGFFPQPLLCARCHGATFEPERVYEAVVEEVSVIRHMLGQTDWQPRRIASVRTSDGQRITVGLTDGPPRVPSSSCSSRTPRPSARRRNDLARLLPRRLGVEHAPRGVGHGEIDHAAVDNGGGAARHRLVERLDHARNNRAPPCSGGKAGCTARSARDG